MNKPNIIEPKLEDVFKSFPEYKITEEYKKIEKEFIEKFLNLFSDDMYLSPPSNDFRNGQMYAKIHELEIKIRYQFDKKYNKI